MSKQHLLTPYNKILTLKQSCSSTYDPGSRAIMKAMCQLMIYMVLYYERRRRVWLLRGL
jgi:cytochrome c biogenesis protein ResB